MPGKAFIALAALAAAGCASTGPDGGFGDVQKEVGPRTGAETKWLRSQDETHAARARVGELLAKPLEADGAVQVALVNNPGLQASYAELGIAGGELLSAGTLPNPRLSYLRASRNGEYKIETILSFNILSLLTVPMAMRAQQERFEQAKLQAAGEALHVAAATRKAYWRALAARELARYAEEVTAAAEASAELAGRMAAAGNFSKLDRMREQAFEADAASRLVRARQQALAERERLVRLLGLAGADAAKLALPEHMPALPGTARDLPDAENAAMAQRLDIQSARRDAEALAKSLGLTRVTRFTDEFELGVARVREDPEPVKKGYEIGVPIPLFDWGRGRVAGAEARYLQAANRIAETAVNARSEVREAYGGYQAAYDVAKRYRDRIVPLRKQISDEMVLRYNGMLVSVFELLADAREQIGAVSASIEALRDYWIADAELQQAMNGGSK